MRIRLSTVFSLGLAGIAGFWLFQTSQNVQQAEHQLRGLKAQLSKEQEAMRVLEAEWDYLNRPDRLEELARQYLKMQPIDPAFLVRDGDVLPDHVPMIVPTRKPDMGLRPASLDSSSSSSGAHSAPASASGSSEPFPADLSPPSERFDSLIQRIIKTEPASGNKNGGVR